MLLFGLPGPSKPTYKTQGMLEKMPLILKLTLNYLFDSCLVNLESSRDIKRHQSQQLVTY
jgi:hypothetical protein